MLRRSLLLIKSSANIQRCISLKPAVCIRQIVKQTGARNDLVAEQFTPPPIEPLDTKQMTALIKASNDPAELLKFLSNTNKDDLEPQHLSIALDQLLAVSKSSGSSRMNLQQIVKHEGFVKMCQMLKFKAPRMETNELVNSLKVLTFFGMSSDSQVVVRLLDLVRNSINDFSPTNLLFLNFMLSKTNATPLTQAIRTAIPAVFDLNIDLKLDRDNSAEISDLIRYMATSSVEISPRSKLMIAKAANSLGQNFTAQQAKSIVTSLSVMRDFEPAFDGVLLNCLEVMSKNLNKFTFHDVETTIDFMMEAYFRGCEVFFNEEFFNSCVKFMIQQDLGYLNASYVLRKFNKMNFVNLELLDYFDAKLGKNDKSLYDGKIAGPITLATGFSNANYKSKHQETFQLFMNENLKSHIQRLEVPWLKLAQDLMALGFHSDLLIERVFSTDYLEKTLNRKQKYSDHMQLLLLWQSVKLLMPDFKGPLPEQKFIDDALLMNKPFSNERFETLLSEIFGSSEVVQTNVTTSFGHILDYVIAFDANETPVAVTTKKYEEIPKDVKAVAVFLHGSSSCPINLPRRLRAAAELKLRTVHALGIKTVGVFSHVLDALPESERAAFLNREIRYALK